MSQLTRKLFKLFCANKVSTPTDNIGVFGSKKAGSSAWSSDPDTIQSAHYLNGWTDAVVSNQAPCMDDMNALQYVFSYMIKYLYQTGVPEWLSTEEYYQYSFVRYNGFVWMSIYNGQNTDTPQDSSDKWRKIALPSIWIAGRSYSTGDLVNYNGKGYKCTVSHTASSIFELDYYGGKWNDSNPAGTIVQSVSWNLAGTPYGYFDVTGADAGAEVSQSTYNNLYQVIGTSYNNCINYTDGSTYGNPASGNFRLPDFRNTFFKNAGSNTRGAGHNATHTHSHNRGSTVNLTHSHTYQSNDNANWSIVLPSVQVGGHWYWASRYINTNVKDGEFVWIVNGASYRTSSTGTKLASLSVPALNLQTQGSGTTPEPNYYGTKILLKY